MGCPVADLLYIMPYEEFICWVIRWQYRKFGEVRQDYRAAMQAKVTSNIMSDGKRKIDLEKFIIKFKKTESDEKTTMLNNLAIANAFSKGCIPKEAFEKVRKNGNSSDTDSTPEA